MNGILILLRLIFFIKMIAAVHQLQEQQSENL